MKRLLITTISLLCVSSAFGGGAEKEQQEAQRVSFEDLREACMNPAKYHNQIAPTNIQITCGELRNKWVAEPDGKMALNTRRVVMTNIVSNKYTVTPSTTELESAQQGVPCTQFKQILETVETVHTTTCEQLLAFKGTSVDYCTTAVDDLRAANPSSIKVQETGRTISFCKSHKQSKDQDQDQDQGQGQKKGGKGG